MLDEDIVPPRAFSVHADLDPLVGQVFGKLHRSELANLIRVEDFGGPMAVASFLSGQILAPWSWEYVNWVIFPPLVLVVALMEVSGAFGTDQKSMQAGAKPWP